VTAGIAYSQSYVSYGSPNSTLTNAAGQPVYNGSVSVAGGSEILTLTDPYQYSPNPFLSYSPQGENDFRAFTTAETKVDDITIHSTLSYLFDNLWYDGPSTLNTIVVDPANTSDIPGTLTTNPSNRVNLNIQAEKPLVSWDTLTIGAQFEHDWLTAKGQDLNDYRDPSSISGALSNYTSGWTTTYSLFFQNKTDFTNKIHLYLGGREDWWSTKGTAWATNTPDTPSITPFSDTYPEQSVTSFSPKASLVYNPTDDLTLRASVGKGFRTPDLLTLYSSNEYYGAFTQAAPHLMPETSVSWETGAEWRIVAGTKVTARYYENYLSNFLDITCGYTCGYVSCVNENAEQATTKGVAVGVEQKIDDNWSVFGNLTRTWSRMDQNIADPASVGARLTFTPNFMANAGLKYINGDWSEMVDAKYVSKVYGNETNSDTATGYPGYYDPYLVFDGKISYQFKDGVKVSLIAKNIGNEHYYEYYLQPGRTVRGEVSYRF
jgi:iron complex outermembrane receptor protein